MPLRPFADRREKLCGREDVIAALVERTRQTGLTALTADPLMDKSWVLQEVARRLEAAGDCLVGWHASFGQGRLALLYALTDLHTTWLANAGLVEQAASVVRSERPDFLMRFGPAFARVSAKLAEGLPVFGKALGQAIQEVMDGLAAASPRLAGGSITLPRLDHDQARDAVAALSAISGRRIVLIIDQWEKSEDAPFELDLLDAFLRHPEDWPSCHIMLGLQPIADLPEQLTRSRR